MASRSRLARQHRAPGVTPDVEISAAPVIKWVGGKTKLLTELVARMPERYGRYFEPFAGGAALFFRLAPRRAVLADSNADLIALYTAIAADANAVIRRLQMHREAHDEQHYYAMRAKWNEHHLAWPPPERAAAFIYLNKTCFNGLWRVNRAGAFNVPIGRYTDPPICPPYDPVTTTANFTSYSADGFSADDQRELARTAKALVERGCKVMLSNSDTPFIRSLYKGMRVDRVKCPRAINSNAQKRGDVDELVISGGY
jgi:DNA adenine methylase